MSSWQKRARVGVAIFGLAVAVIVYVALRPRETPVAPPAIQRTDPKAVMEVTGGGGVERVTLDKKNFKLSFLINRTYEDGSSKVTDLVLTVPKGENRMFTVSGREAGAKDESDFDITGGVKLEDTDGFVLTTDRATYRADAIANAPGPVVFGKGRMSGTGVGVSYDQPHDLLVIGQQAHITTKDGAGNPTMELTAGTATLDRIQHRLILETNVHIVRGDQIIDTDHAVASLSENDDIITFVALRGNSRVEGGDSSIDAMTARDINLDYTDDGTRLEGVELNGGAAVAMKEQGRADQQILSELMDLKFAADGSSRMVLTNKASVVTAGEGGRSGRTIASDALELDVAADGSLTRAVGRENVRLDLPAAPGAPVRSIGAKLLDGRGTAGKGLTSATFTGDVRFNEQATKGASARTARAQKLEAAMANDAVTTATFTGDVTFEERGLKACAGRLDYQPDNGTLALSLPTPAGGLPTVAEEQVNIEAQTINVALQVRRIVATGFVTTRMGSGTRCKPSEERPAAERGATRLPGLLNADAAATIKAATLDYQGAAGKAVYTGSNPKASIAQGETTIIGDKIELDQTTGDLTVTGNAISTMKLDGGESTGRAYQLRYLDASRAITYAAPPAGYVAPPAPVGVTVVRLPQLQVPQGNIRAGSRIEITLAKEGGKAARIKAWTDVTMIQRTTPEQSRTASGGARFTYEPNDKRFDMEAEGTTPVKIQIIDRSSVPPSCRESSGRSLTFYESGDSIVIDGQQKNRTQITPSPCPPR